MTTNEQGFQKATGDCTACGFRGQKYALERQDLGGVARALMDGPRQLAVHFCRLGRSGLLQNVNFSSRKS